MKKVFLALFFVCFLVLLSVFYIQFVKVNNITCKTQAGNCNFGFKKGNIISTWFGINNLLKNNNSVDKYLVQFELPNNFEVDVVVKQPVVTFLLKNGRFDEVSDDGSVVDETSQTELPQIKSVNLNHNQLVFVVGIVEVLNRFYGVNSATVDENGINAIVEGKNVIFPLVGDRDVLVGSLGLILSRLKDGKEVTTIKTIDLRFKNPVLR